LAIAINAQAARLAPAQERNETTKARRIHEDKLGPACVFVPSWFNLFFVRQRDGPRKSRTLRNDVLKQDSSFSEEKEAKRLLFPRSFARRGGREIPVFPQDFSSPAFIANQAPWRNEGSMKAHAGPSLPS
jgi:hypothetical protein